MSKEFWLVKLPGYVHEDWEKQVSGERKLVGYIDVTPDMPNRPPKMELKLTSAEVGAPMEMPLTRKNPPGYPMLMFAENTSMSDGEARSFQLQGEISHIVEARPPLSAAYKAFINQRNERKAAAKRTEVFRDVHDTVRVTDMATKLAMQKQIRREEKATREKRFRSDETEVVAMLREMFRKQPYYSLSEISEITQQPKAHLTTILKTWCVQHTSGEFNGKYSLKDANVVMR